MQWEPSENEKIALSMHAENTPQEEKAVEEMPVWSPSEIECIEMKLFRWDSWR